MNQHEPAPALQDAQSDLALGPLPTHSVSPLAQVEAWAGWVPRHHADRIDVSPGGASRPPGAPRSLSARSSARTPRLRYNLVGKGLTFEADLEARLRSAQRALLRRALCSRRKGQRP